MDALIIDGVVFPVDVADRAAKIAAATNVVHVDSETGIHTVLKQKLTVDEEVVQLRREKEEMLSTIELLLDQIDDLMDRLGMLEAD